MKNIKKRIKRALSGFLREELLDYIGYNHNIPYMSLNDRFKVDDLSFETMVMEVDIPVSEDPFRFEDDIENCKQRFADQVIKHIHVDAQNLTDRESFRKRSVRFVLRVQTVKK